MNKGLPNNIDAEKALIGSMFWSRSSLQKGCEDIEKEFFYLDSNAKIFEVIKDLYNYRELLKTSVQKDIGGKYKHSFLGVLWSFINPLLQIAVYAIIFPLIIKNNIPNYTVYMVCGLMPWNFFSTVLNRSTWVMVENRKYNKKSLFS